MNDLLATLATFVLLCVSAGIGRYLHPRLPETYRTRETMEATQLVCGMLITFAALVLGLLTASVKNTYDTAARDRHAYALQLVQLDQCLRDYGPEAASAREDIKSYTAAVIASTWRNEPPPAGVRYPDISNMPVVGAAPVLGDLLDQVGQKTRRLDPATPVQTRTAEDCRATFRDVIHARLAVIEDAGASFSKPFFWILVFWLTVIFLMFGLSVPRNKLSLVGLLLCAISISSAILVISDLSRPYRGWMAISSHDMRDALDRMMAPGK
jgi:hypothetical protein